MDIGVETSVHVVRGDERQRGGIGELMGSTWVGKNCFGWGQSAAELIEATDDLP